MPATPATPASRLPFAPLLLLTLLASVLMSADLRAQAYFEEKPILYGQAPVNDRVARLARQLESGEVKLRHRPRRGYLESLLEALEISPTSQVLVFSKTSFQLRRISPRTPRALYFNDDTYVGYVQGGEVLEISTQDPRQGAIFYTLDQRGMGLPRLSRQNYECTSCHASSMTRGVPGHVVRSVYTAPDGQPILRAGTFVTDDASPFEERWGGWYVTGTHGRARHLGNIFSPSRDEPYELDREKGANLVDLSRRIETRPYLTPHSDLIALMVLEHQTQLQNLITRAGFQTRRALWDQGVIDEALDRRDDRPNAATRRRIDHSVEALVEYLLGAKAIQWKEPIAGTSGFAEQFARKGSRDSRGRSLRDLDLRTRLFRHHLSPWIQSEAFLALPPEALESAYQRLWLALTSEGSDPLSDHLDAGDRRAILEILKETQPGLPAYYTATDDMDDPDEPGASTATF